MASNIRVRSALMMIIIIVVISIPLLLYVEASSEVSMESAIQAQESETSTDWFGVFCCLFVMLVTVGFPIAIIVFISKFIQGSGKKVQPEATRNYNSKQNRSFKTTEPIWMDPNHGLYRKDVFSDHRTVSTEKKPKPRVKISDRNKKKPPEVEKEIIEMDLTTMEIEKEPEMPKFERPQALNDEEKDEFIIDRIMELQGMLKDGDIDKTKYDQLKKRLMDQLED